MSRDAMPMRESAVTVKWGGGFLAAAMLFAGSAAGAAPCDTPANVIVAENCLPGAPPSEWDIGGAGDASIQGFATDMSVNVGQTIGFKIDTDATNYRLDIYRLGYYAGLGARQVAVVQPSAPLPQNQPACLSDTQTGLVDCGNWTLSASWAVPPSAASGVYIAKLVREDPDDGRASHVVFVVRDDAGGSDLLVQTSDTTWQAYNMYGGNSLYNGAPDGRAYKVSYNRPFTTRCCEYPSGSLQSWLFNAEYPMLRWLERNGYDVSYTSGVDADRFGAEMTEHAVYLSVGHDEYWSAAQRANVAAARDAGVHLAFFSGNEGFWKTRWEPSIDGSATPRRTLVCYKETHANAKIDPLPGVWTGTWRDPRFGPHDAGRPENELNGTIFTVNGERHDTLEVPATDGKMRFWRNTSIATLPVGQVAALPTGTLGYEWDEDLDNGARPLGIVRLSTTTVGDVPLLQDYGSTYASGSATHHLLLYRAASGSLVFGAGTVQWSWGLDDEHDRAGTPSDARMQQATVNLFADMDVQPGSLQPGLVPAVASSDVAAPASSITAPANGASVSAGQPVNIAGTATDVGGGAVGAVEVSVDGGLTWHPAIGRGAWSYTWVPITSGPATIQVRAVDDSANRAVTATSIGVTVEGPDQGPGGPILVIASAANPFGRYYSEILRAEGLNAFAVEDIDAVSAATLAAYDVVILGEMSLSPGQVAMLSNWVTAGGNLIAMRPDAQLAPLLGLTDLPTSLADAYVLVNTASAPGAGIVGQTVQFHGTADRYSINGATAVATLYSAPSTPTTNPAVTLRSIGGSGGQAAAFAYDLARSVVYTRQGNPLWAGQERDGSPPIRSDDLFFPNWINFNKVAIPQADEQQRLLANLILHMALDRAPLPRFWYFPRDERAVVIMTGDDHGSGGTAGRFDQHVGQSAPGCSVADWECVRATSYIFPGTPIDDAAAQAYESQGFELALHVDTGCADWTPQGLDDFFAAQRNSLFTQLPSLDSVSTLRLHCIPWSDWFGVPTIALGHGVRLDTNYYYWPPSWIQDRPGMFTGSGMPMRFADTDGSIIDVYQAVTQMTDESGQSYPLTVDTLLDRAIGPLGYYGAFTANMHTDSEQSSGADAIVASAQARGVPIISARQMLEWLDGRNGSAFTAIAFTADHLDFGITAAAGSTGLRAMVPRISAQGGVASSVTRDGNAVPMVTQTIKGVDYAVFDALPGAYRVAYPVAGDGDGDGWAPPSDCNDADVTVHPGAVEACNAIDDDCDAQTDEGCPPTPTRTATSTPLPPTPTRTATATAVPATPTPTATATQTATRTVTATPGLCGNSNVDPSEQCDDGNTVGGDCCSTACQFEPAGSLCSDFNTCTAGEACDAVGRCVGFTACNTALTCDICGSKCRLQAGTCRCG